MVAIELRRVGMLGDEIAPLVAEADGEGFRFVRRLRDEWRLGAKRFDGDGELLLAAYRAGELVAVGGLTIDPYTAAPGVGRVRHVYVLRSARRSGVGETLVRRIMDEASRTFTALRLRTTTAEGAAFYEQLGFLRTTEPAATHVIALGELGIEGSES